MREMMYVDHKGEKTHLGYSNQIRWLSTEYFRAPRQSGKYLVRFKNGIYDTVSCTGDENGMWFVEKHIHNGSEIFHDDGTEFSADEILKLGAETRIWYDIEDDEGYGYNDVITIQIAWNIL